MDTIRKITAYRLQTLRNRLGLSQMELGRMLGVTKQTVKLMEAGRRDIAPKYIDILREEFALPAFYFFFATENEIHEESSNQLIDYMASIGGNFKQSGLVRKFDPEKRTALTYMISFLSDSHNLRRYYGKNRQGDKK